VASAVAVLRSAAAASFLRAASAVAGPWVDGAAPARFLATAEVDDILSEYNLVTMLGRACSALSCKCIMYIFLNVCALRSRASV
jgi:hypothetical protein